MPGLIGTMARTAVIAGTATTVSNRVSRRQAGRWAEQEQAQAYREQAYYQQPPAQPAPAAVPAAPAAAETPPAEDMNHKLAQLQQLGELKAQGILTDEEFQAEKAKILGH
ncbi:MAG: SHOCT domain-containing protein [Chloroflexi bacterium]|nr:SHOCT domain-containing protein [Chloroflexota bacterium]